MTTGTWLVARGTGRFVAVANGSENALVSQLLSWLRGPFAAEFALPLRLRVYALGLAVVGASVPFLHLYLEVDLSWRELGVHALDISLGTALALAGVELLGLAWQRTPTWQIELSRWQGVALGVAVVALALVVQQVSHDWLPMTDEIRQKHDRAGYTDMTLRVIPLVALQLAFVALLVRSRLLGTEVALLRSLNARLAERETVPVASDPAAAQSLIVRHEGDELALDTDSISHVQAEENYCRIFVGAGPDGASGKQLLVRMTLAEVLAKLPEPAFAQVHRSHVVGLRHVREIARAGRSDRLILADGSEIPVSRARSAVVRARVSASVSAGAR